MGRLGGLVIVALGLVACGNGDDLKVGRATGVFNGIDGVLGGQCECLTEVDGLYLGTVIKLECLHEFIYIAYPEGHLNETVIGGFSTLSGWSGTAYYELGSPEDRDGVPMAPLWIDALISPPQDACQTYVGGYYYYYTYEECTPYEGGELHNARAWCTL